MNRIHVFDIDGTIACSKHRQNTLPDGSLDLNHWRENSTAEKVAQDSRLPLADLMAGLGNQAGQVIVICTARVMSKPDWDWLTNQGLLFHYALSRIEGDTTPDAELKRRKLLDLFVKMRWPVARYKDVILYDDNRAVLTMAQSLGLKTVDAVAVNHLLAAGVVRV